ncbi:MAG: hypothetical protein ACE5FN_10550 [Leptospirillia bacterium]
MEHNDINVDEQFADMMEDQGAGGSTVVSLDVEITWPDHDSVKGCTRELSDEGVVVEARFDEIPPHGAVLYAKLMEASEVDETPVIKTRVAKVVDASSHCLELEFIMED